MIPDKTDRYSARLIAVVAVHFRMIAIQVPVPGVAGSIVLGRGPEEGAVAQMVAAQIVEGTADTFAAPSRKRGKAALVGGTCVWTLPTLISRQRNTSIFFI